MAPTSTILRLTYLLVAVLSCEAFAPSAVKTCNSVTSLSAMDSDVNRRSFIATISTAGITLIGGGDNISNAAEEEKPSKPKRLPLDSYLYQILRVREVSDSCAYASNMLYLCR